MFASKDIVYSLLVLTETLSNMYNFMYYLQVKNKFNC
jgi:hypothetical protein